MSDTDYLERYIAPVAAYMREQLIKSMTDEGIWLEQAEYILTTMFNPDAPSFEEFLDSPLGHAMYAPFWGRGR